MQHVLSTIGGRGFGLEQLAEQPQATSPGVGIVGRHKMGQTRLQIIIIETMIQGWVVRPDRQADPRLRVTRVLDLEPQVGDEIRMSTPSRGCRFGVPQG